METKHIQNVTENDDSVTITFRKTDGSNDKGNSKESGIETTVSSVSKEKRNHLRKKRIIRLKKK